MDITPSLVADVKNPVRNTVRPGAGFRVGRGGKDLVFEGVETGGAWRFTAMDEPSLLAETRIRRFGEVAILETVLENTAPQAFTGIDRLEPLYLEFDHPGQTWRHLYAQGGTADFFYPPRAFRTCEYSHGTRDLHLESDPGGRSSLRHLPLCLSLLDHGEASAGLFCGMEWSGLWALRFGAAEADTSRLCLGIPVQGLRIEPGERLALPAVHIGFFTGGAAVGGNLLRRHLYDRVCPRLGGNPVVPRVSYDHWFGIGCAIDETVLKTQARRAARLGVETFVVDAGWFGTFPEDVGTWETDATKLPGGLEPVADYVRSLGMDFGLWFEIERAEAGSKARREHPELFIPSPPGYDARAEGHILYDGGKSALLNLARRDAQDWAIETVSHWIQRLGLKWSRWDFNLSPAAYWQAADPTGKIQFAYQEGLYRVLDTLMARHPDWIIEGCASGGRRIDLGTLRRSHALWISDHSVTAPICRYMQARANRFLPAHLLNSSVAVKSGQNPDEFDDTALLSRMLGKLSLDGAVASWSAAQARRARRWVSVFKQVRHLFSGDFFQLLPQPQNAADWDAVLFAARDRSEAAVFIFAGSRGGTLTLRLQGLCPESNYILTRLPLGRSRKHTAADLQTRGRRLKLSAGQSALWVLKQADGNGEDE